MPIRVKCGNCKKTLSVKDHLAGKKIKCPVCQTVVAVPLLAPALTPVTKNPGSATKPALITKPLPDKSKSNGTPPGAAKSNGTPAPVELPTENVEAEALAAFSDAPPPPPVDDSAPKTIGFKCSWCDEDVELPVEMGGKQAPCPNPECKRIIKVPMPKAPEKKDWRKMDRQGPALARINQPEQLENAWGTEEATRARQDSLAQAGAIAKPPPKAIGIVDWLRYASIGLGAVVAVVLVYLGVSRLIENKYQSSAIKEVEQLVKGKGAKVQTPLLAAEAYRTLGLLHLHAKERNPSLNASHHFLGALGSVDLELAKNPTAINENLFLIDLALAQIELGGDDEEILIKARLPWEKVRDELSATLQKIKAPEVQVLALREVGTRLFEKKQAELAVGLAATLGGAEGKRLTPFRQQIALLFVMPDQEDKLQKIVKKPDLAVIKELQDAFARIGYAEGFARKDDYANALALAQFSGPPRDKLDACLGVAAVAWQRKNKDETATFVKAALSIASQRDTNATDWQKLQLVKLAARTEDAETVKDLVKGMREPFKLRAYYEIFLASGEKSPGELSVDALSDLEAVDKEGSTLAMAWVALAQHNARKGMSRDKNRVLFADRVLSLSAAPEALDRIRPMVDVGSYLGTMK